MNSRIRNDLGRPHGERANGELKELEFFGGEPGLGVGGLGSVEGENAVPWSGDGASFLERYGHEVGLGDLRL